jgi:hypothetical protein
MRTAITLVLAVGLSGCFFVSKKNNTSNRSQPSTVSEPKNHGQERSQEVHDRNDARKAEKDAAKGK